MSNIQTKAKIDSEGTLVIERVQDVESILKQNAQIRADNQLSRFTRHRSETLNPIADIPNVIIEKWLNEKPPLNVYLVGSDPEHTKRFRQRMNSSEFRLLRLSNTRI